MYATPASRTGISRGVRRRLVHAAYEDTDEPQNSDHGPEVPEDPGSSNGDKRPLNAQERILLNYYKQTVEDLRQQVTNLSISLRLSLEQNQRLPEYVDWKKIKKKMRFVSRNLILGCRKTSSIYREFTDIRDEIFEALNIGPLERTASALTFEKYWSATSDEEPGLQHEIIASICNYRGPRADKLREGLYHFFPLRQPKKRAPQAEKDAFLAALGDLRVGNVWRVLANDPFGSDAVFEAVALMMKGPNFDIGPLEITLDIARFAIHVMELAMEGKVMDPHNQMHHFREMKGTKARVMRQIPNMRRILIVEKEGAPEEDMEMAADDLGSFQG